MKSAGLRAEGISQKMLTLTLKGLERDGLTSRTVYPTIPPRVDYELTKLRRGLLIPVIGLARWAAQNRERIQSARERYDTECQALVVDAKPRM